MDWIYPKQIPSGTVKMLHVRSTGSFKILKKLNCNTYVINLPRDYDINCTFNVNNLVDYKGFDCGPLIVEPSPKSFPERPQLSLPNNHYVTTKNVDKILEDETITTKTSGTHRYLNCCKRKTPTVDLQRIDPMQHWRPNPSKLNGVEFSPTRGE